ncbi:hypothetical protein JEQ48_001724 [Campylobacter jejuni]|nr:hypothetical protein [Campylobacter jejuni]EKJ7206953.1 hypothetical protein [Campylobacter jejuni]EKJ7432634.1 hypothetical protein [Campylobacter jejuni]
MKKILTSALALGAMTLIVDCGDGDLVELKNNGNDQAMFDFVGGKIKCRKRKIKCRIFATNYLSFNLKLKL